MVQLRFALAVFLLVSGISWVGAQVHHVVGGDRGWDPDSGVGSWSSGRVFSIGDTLWFTYSAAQESIVELRTKEEYESCDLTNPIKMYTDGINSLPLNKQGLRCYFASSNSENCNSGLKLHVDVQPRSPWVIQGVAMSEDSAIALAEAPSSPSSSPRFKVDLAKVGMVVLVSLFGIYNLAM